MTSKQWVSLLAVLATACCFSLQGNWTLLSNPKVPQVGPPVTLEISDYIFMNQSILQKLNFKGCNQMLLQSEFTENQIFINPSSYYSSPLTGLDCSQLKVNPLDVLFQGLANVFYFSIVVDVLNLNDPFGKTLYSFKRVAASKSVDISGVWSMNQYANTRTSLSVQISTNQISLCQGYSVYNYSFPSARNTISLVAVKNSCPSQDLTQAVNAIKYYRLNNGILDFYDKNVALIVQLVYSTPYDPTKPIFTSPTAPTPAPTSPPPKPTRLATPSPNPLAGGVTASNIAGSWSIVSLFSISFPKTSYSLLISATTITLNGGCNNYTYQYTLTPATQLITIGASTQTKNPCAQSDDQLYVSGITKMYKYLVSSSASAYSLIFYDQTGTAGYSLYSKIAAPAAPSVLNTQASTPNLFANGQALMLVLQRRDLPRAIVTITPTSISYTLCNTITHNYKVDTPGKSKGSITVTGGASTNNLSCSKSNDQVYIGSLNSAVSYSYDPNANTIVFTNKDGADVITFNRT